MTPSWCAVWLMTCFASPQKYAEKGLVLLLLSCAHLFALRLSRSCFAVEEDTAISKIG